MSHGLIIRNAGNTVILDTSGFSIRTFHTQILGAIPSGGTTISVPGVTPGIATAWLNYESSVPNYINIPYCEVVNDGVFISGPGASGYQMRLYVAAMA